MRNLVVGVMPLLLVTTQVPAEPGPAFNCDQVVAGSIEALICGDPALSALDRQLAEVYRRAVTVAVDAGPPALEAEQHGWIKGRNACWKSEDRGACVESEYRHRIAELQARYRMVPGKGPISFICDEQPGRDVVVTYFETDPPTLVAEHGDSLSLMYRQPSGSGARYEGRNETFWEHQGEAMITWGYGAPTMKCKPGAR